MKVCKVSNSYTGKVKAIAKQILAPIRKNIKLYTNIHVLPNFIP